MTYAADHFNRFQLLITVHNGRNTKQKVLWPFFSLCNFGATLFGTTLLVRTLFKVI